MKKKLLLYVFLIFFSYQGITQTTYHVGPGKAYTTIGAVPWESLVAGDSVLIYWQSQPYKEKWVIGVQGTAQKPIVIKGIPDNSGNLPVIDGIDATTRTQLNFWSEGRGIIKFGGSNIPGKVPSYIILESLEIKNGRDAYSYTGRSGVATYNKNCAAIFIEEGNHITIRNCILTNCGNGLFTSHASEDVVVEGCYIYGNGNIGSIYEHNNYTESKRITFEYNRFGTLCNGCSGNNLKDRSAGTVIRYNWIEGGNRQLDLVESDNSDVSSLPEYDETWVYGNILFEPNNDGNSQIVHYGGDLGDETIYRKGKLFFYNNTIVSKRTGNTTLFRLSTNDETAECFNNIIYVSGSGNLLGLVDETGVVNLSRNWIKTGYVSTHGTLAGTINNAGDNITGSAPGFTNADSNDFTLLSSSVCRDTAKAIPGSHPLTSQYVLHQKYTARPYSFKTDLGAFEYNAGEVPPAKYILTVNSGSGSGQFYKDAKVIVSANAAPSGKIFDKWTGDVQYLKNETDSVNEITMPAKNITITATYKNKPIAYEMNNINISVYPNPTSEYIFISLAEKTDGMIQVFNATGIKIVENNITSTDILMNVAGWAKGVYVVRIVSKENVFERVIVVQ